MKFLYVSSVSSSRQYSGILKKIAGQTEAVGRLGWKAHYVYLDGDSVILHTGTGDSQRRDFAHGLRWRKRQEAVTQAVCAILSENGYDAVYIKGFLATPYGLEIASCAKHANPACRVIYEVATYPYWGEYRRYFRDDWKNHDFQSFAGHVLEVLQHFSAAPRMKGRTDAVVVFGQPIKRLWGIPAVTVDNGITVDRIGMRQNGMPAPGSAIHLLGVAGTSVAHGYSRILEGMAQYRNGRPSGSPDIFFDIVGGNETIRALKAQADELGLAKEVHFLGYRSSEELAKLYGVCDAAVSSLGAYRLGLKYLCPLKSREYCAAGIPFLYAYEDTLPADAPFALKLPNDPSPVKMETVARFVENCRKNPQIALQERKYAEEHYDWKIIMKRVLAFAGAAVDENH